MGFEKGDAVVLSDKHSDHDGDVGEVSQVSETMFGDNTYIVQFEEGQEAGIPAESLEAAEE
jgi:beta-lactamase superfamily II metal-dependent hydrolase